MPHRGRQHHRDMVLVVMQIFRKGRFIFLKRNLYLMYAMALLQGMVFYGPIATLYRQAAGLSIFQITAIESVSLVLTLLLELPWGYVADRIGYRRTMVFCSGLFLVSKVVFWRADGFGLFLLERMLLSVVGAGLSGVEALHSLHIQRVRDLSVI